MAPRGKARPEGSSLIGSIVDRINYLRQEKLSGLDVAATKFVVGDTRHYGKMSAGDGHRRPNKCSALKVHELLGSGGAPELMRRWRGLSDAYDIPDLAGYNVAGTERYIDRDAMRAILDPAYAQQILGEPVQTGLSPKDTIDAILLHEAVRRRKAPGSALPRARTPCLEVLRKQQSVSTHPQVTGWSSSAQSCPA